MSGFDTFWSLYPRKVAKIDARTAFDRALKLTDEATIIAGAQRYAKERAGEAMKYTKHPASWLNAGCWDDEEGANAGTDAKSLNGAFDRLEQRLTSQSANDHSASADVVQLLPARRLR